MSFGSRKEKVKNIVADKAYRDFYNETYLKKWIPFQVKTLRNERKWSQEQAGEALGKGQNAISRLESPSYSKVTLQTLIEIAQGYDVGLIVKFVPFSRLLKEYEDVSSMSLRAPSPTDEFPDEIQALNDWANSIDDSGYWENPSRENTIGQIVIKNYLKTVSIGGGTPTIVITDKRTSENLVLEGID